MARAQRVLARKNLPHINGASGSQMYDNSRLIIVELRYKLKNIKEELKAKQATIE